MSAGVMKVRPPVLEVVAFAPAMLASLSVTALMPISTPPISILLQLLCGVACWCCCCFCSA